VDNQVHILGRANGGLRRIGNQQASHGTAYEYKLLAQTIPEPIGD